MNGFLAICSIAARLLASDSLAEASFSQHEITGRRPQVWDFNAIAPLRYVDQGERPFTPIDADNVRMYGLRTDGLRLRPYRQRRGPSSVDVLFRLLRHLYGEAHVTYVRNITDVDDKDQRSRGAGFSRFCR